MKKKYLAIILASVLCSFSFLSACGQTAEPAAESEDEEDEEDDEDDEDEDEDEDEDDEEDEKPSGSAVVKEIDDNILASQIDVFIADRDKWIIPYDEAVEYDATVYSLNDLNYNGRAELIVSYWQGTGTYTHADIYEINAKGDGYDLLDWEITGIDAKDGAFPDLTYFDAVTGYYDKENGNFHYLYRDYYASSFTEGGCRYHDMYISDGRVYCNVYAKSDTKGSDRDEINTFTGPDGEMTEQQFISFINSYPEGFTTRDFWSGNYYGESVYDRSHEAVEFMTDDDLRTILADSYHTFAGKLSYSDFFDAHIASASPDQTSESLFYDSIGSWELGYTDVEGDVNYYDSDSEFFITLEIYDDWTMHMECDLNTDHPYSVDAALLERADAQLMAQFTPGPGVDVPFDFATYSLIEIDSGGFLVVSADTWQGDVYWGGGTWYFERVD